jgi:hypothetical protein
MMFSVYFTGLPRWIVLCGWVGLACSLMGCQPPPRPPVKTAASQEETVDETSQVPADKPQYDIQPKSIPLRFAIEDELDLWDAYYFNGEHIGYSHIKSEIDNRKKQVRYTITERILVRRGEVVQDHLLVQTTEETLSGQLLRFDAELTVNGEKTTTAGQVRGRQLLITTTQSGKTPQSTTAERSVPWSDANRGLLGLQQFLREDPPTKGETHKLAVLAPLFYQLGEIEVKAIGNVAVALLDGEPVPALELETVSSIEGGNKMQNFVWIDEQGNILKSYIPSLQLTILRTDQLVATSFETPQQDALAATAINVRGTMLPANELSVVGYLVRAKNPESPVPTIGVFPGQSIETRDGFLRVAVAIDETLEDTPTSPSFPSTEGDLAPARMIESQDQHVISIANGVSGTANSTELAISLAVAVNQHITEKTTSDSFVSAATAASSRRGDCTEHALLTAALCRARGIPARTAVGLLYDPNSQPAQMRFHMWTLAYVANKWIHLDAMHPSGLAFPDRIILTTDDLSSGREYLAAATVAEFAGSLEIEIFGSKKRIAPLPTPKKADSLDELLKSLE